MSHISSFNVSYDRRADVLYISKRIEPAARGLEDEYGIVWRYSRDGELISATVMDFHDLWTDKKLELADALSDHFHISHPQAEVVVDHAFDL